MVNDSDEIYSSNVDRRYRDSTRSIEKTANIETAWNSSMSISVALEQCLNDIVYISISGKDYVNKRVISLLSAPTVRTKLKGDWLNVTFDADQNTKGAATLW